MPGGFAETINNLFSSARYRVEGDSMSPALSHGNQVLAAHMRRQYQRGDVVAFQQPFEIPGASSKVWIKRIIGLPQEEIIFDEGSVRINGVVLPEAYLAEPARESNADQVRETARIWITDAGEYFVMGDKRDDSLDSRRFGPVEESLILGRVWLRYWPLGAWGTIPGGGQT